VQEIFGQEPLDGVKSLTDVAEPVPILLSMADEFWSGFLRPFGFAASEAVPAPTLRSITPRLCRLCVTRIGNT
jgi:hypothetical protein